VIPSAYIQEWSATTPWPDPRQVEQDLIICRVLCDIPSESFLADHLAFRGGTAINKLLFRAPLRYSEDIDLVHARPEPSARPLTHPGCAVMTRPMSSQDRAPFDAFDFHLYARG
jgi:hypothetical protein